MLRYERRYMYGTPSMGWRVQTEGSSVKKVVKNLAPWRINLSHS